jgi:hypothetical protein
LPGGDASEAQGPFPVTPDRLIVFTNLTNPVLTGIVQSFARPGVNLTGATS